MSDNEDDNVDNSLPYGAYPILLSRKTQEILECIANWDVSVFEPLKFVAATEVKDDLEKKGDESDFFKLSEEINTSEISELLFVLYSGNKLSLKLR